jgi:hypothetical protein
MLSNHYQSIENLDRPSSPRLRIPFANRPPKVILPQKGKGSYSRLSMKWQLRRSLTEWLEDV